MLSRLRICADSCADPESFVRGGQLVFFLCLADKGREDPITPKSGPSMAFRWRADDGSTLNAGLVAL